jgi:hypothetical protein
MRRRPKGNGRRSAHGSSPITLSRDTECNHDGRVWSGTALAMGYGQGETVWEQDKVMAWSGGWHHGRIWGAHCQLTSAL